MEQEIKSYIDNYLQLIMENHLWASIVILIALKLFNDIKSLSKISKSLPDRFELTNEVVTSVKNAIDKQLKTSLLGFKNSKNISIEHRIALFFILIHEIASLPIVGLVTLFELTKDTKH